MVETIKQAMFNALVEGLKSSDQDLAKKIFQKIIDSCGPNPQILKMALPIARHQLGKQIPKDVTDFVKKLLSFCFDKLPFAPINSPEIGTDVEADWMSKQSELFYTIYFSNELQ